MESIENVTPFTKYRARRPGEGLDQRINRLIVLSGLALAIMCFLAGMFVGNRLLPNDRSLDVLYLVVMGICLVVFLAVTQHLDRQHRNAVLGREGEREVGAQLAELERCGARVLHDIQAGKFNVDHVVFHTSGIFAIETKTWSSRRTGVSRLRFDGRSVWKGRFRARRDPTRQAIGQAKWLREHLTGMGLRLKEPVQAIVVFPGWKIDVVGENPLVRVMNPWDLCATIRNSSRSVLTPKQVEFFYSKLRRDQTDGTS